MPWYTYSHWLRDSLVLALLLTVFVVTRPAFRQTNKEVVIRMPGERLLKSPQPAKPSATEDFPYALISCSAYDQEGGRPRCPTAAADLGVNWSSWKDFPSKSLQAEMSAVHLRARVWENRSQGVVVVAFGGTEATNWKDWIANTHWLHPFIKDEYTVLGQAFVGNFAEEFTRREKQPGQEYLKSANLVATGHSLGAGLAQKFAYSLPAAEFQIPRVKMVYAFDTSPVTSFMNTSFGVRQENKQGLDIYRIYERGEMLAILRALTSLVHPPPKENPRVIQRRYNVFGDDRYGLANPLASHSISELANGLKNLAQE